MSAGFLSLVAVLSFVLSPVPVLTVVGWVQTGTPKGWWRG